MFHCVDILEAITRIENYDIFIALSPVRLHIAPTTEVEDSSTLVNRTLFE